MKIQLPDELATRLSALLPEGERDRFAVAAIADALVARQQEADAAECVAAVEGALADMDVGRDLVYFEDVRRQWEAEKAARRVGQG